MSRNIISDDLPYERPLGDPKLYLVRLSVGSETGIDSYDVIVRARSLRDAAEQGGLWCRARFNRPARSIDSIQSEESHAVQMARAAGLPVEGASSTPYTEEEIAAAHRDHALRERGEGAFVLVHSEVFHDA